MPNTKECSTDAGASHPMQTRSDSVGYSLSSSPFIYDPASGKSIPGKMNRTAIYRKSLQLLLGFGESEETTTVLKRFHSVYTDL
ncbi:hypothetical protein CDAR_99641 [Caerostris darwini]|uniref:Uncharacterized protein n=1 Tax=Caerostris darwini TaxID=1538125 RepID=A0AAV4VRC9_9ARAC|nr:hypothetical protein CDAR_99641 [Caerostris darwini]